MGDLFAGIGDLVFTLVIGYIGAIEFLYVVRHLYHWSCNHDDELGINDAEHLDRLQENMRTQLIDASNREANAGTNAMKDGVFYKDGFRIDPGQEDIDRLSDEYRKKGEKDEHRRKLEEELARQQKIKEQTQRELEEAEALLARQQREDAENARKLSEAKKLKEEKQAEQEAIENDRKHKELEKRRQAEQQKKAEEEARKKEELERQKAIELEQQRLRDKLETEENFKRLLAAEKQYEKDQELAEKQLTHVGSDEPKEDEPHLSGALAREHGDEKKEDVLLKQILEAKALLSEESDDNEEAQRLFQIEKDRESRQKLIDHNALLFLEAEKEMAELQKQMLEAVEKREFTQNLESAPQTPVIEEPCVKKIIKPLNTDDPFKPLTQTVKTQLSQTQDTPYSATPKALHFPGIADNASSAEDSISQQLPISAQPSKEITAAGIAEQLPYSDSERERPEGEDNTSQQEYSEEYLRSLDGIKHRPLVREDGSGRRRAFKKRRSSGSSNSSRDSRTSREEELKMFTSLEEEEMKNKDDSDFTPIRYTSEPTLKVKGHHRRHKRSPVKDSKASEESSTGSLERLGEETVDPWGEVMQAPYKETEFWRREKAFSIDEEEIDLERLTSSGEQTFETATNVPSASSFEDATQTQNIEAITNLQKQTGKSTTDDRHIESIQEDATGKGEKANVTEESSSSPQTSASPGLNLIPHGVDMEPSATTVSPPTIKVQPSSDFGPWRDEHDLIMEGLSDFYDFSASVNPSRSRSTSRNPSEAKSPCPTPKANSPRPKNVSFDFNAEGAGNSSIEIYDDTDANTEITPENISNFLESLDKIQKEYEIKTQSAEFSNIPNDNLELKIVPIVNNMDDSNENEIGSDDVNSLVESLRAQRCRSRSRSRSPLPTADNIQRGLETRRNKLIKHNEEIKEKLIESQMLPKSQASLTEDESFSKESVNLLVQSLRSDKSRSRSHSPLPTADNIQRSLEHRRNKLIQKNDEFYEALIATESNISQIINMPCILIESAESVDRENENCSSPRSDTKPTISVEITETATAVNQDDEDCSREQMENLIQSLRIGRSRSRSRSPLPPTTAAVDIIAERNEQYIPDNIGDRYNSRSRTPSRSLSPELDINNTLNEQQQRLLDQEALEKLKNASEEIELKILPPLNFSNKTNEDLRNENLEHTPTNEEKAVYQSSTTPDYDRTLSEEARDVERIKAEMLAKGFRRSTYAGESMDLGSEYESLRRETAQFRRSLSPTPEDPLAYSSAAEKRKIQDIILTELIASGDSDESSALKFESNKTGAIPKVYDADISTTTRSLDQYEKLRRRNAEFRRSGSKSRSPLAEEQLQGLAAIEAEAAIRELKDKILDEIGGTSENFKDFSRHLNVDFFDHDRRASDSAIIQKPDLMIQLQDHDPDLFMDPEEYHHFRRFSLYQDEQPTEDYPSDEYVYIQQVEIRTQSGSRTWISEDYYGEEIGTFDVNNIEPPSDYGGEKKLLKLQANKDLKVSELNSEDNINEVELKRDIQSENVFHDDYEEDDTNGSEDERQTVVEVEDEIDEDISDFNDRGPAEESHHEQSECEEAEREMDRYANRDARDWEAVVNVDDILLNAREEESGAVGDNSSAQSYDSDSVTIDQIYDEAVKNRKQSGILRDYDTILQEMSNNFMRNTDDDNDEDVLPANICGMEKPKDIECKLNPTDKDCRQLDVHYLDNVLHSARSRYGYNPLLGTTKSHSNEVDDGINYTPKKEYNWRKNFKLDDDIDSKANDDTIRHTSPENENQIVEKNQRNETEEKQSDMKPLDCEEKNVCDFNQSSEKELHFGNGAVQEEKCKDSEAKAIRPYVDQEPEKPKQKKKTKKKSCKDTKTIAEILNMDEDDSEYQVTYSRRSSSIQLETDSPKRKSRSRRSSKSSLSNDTPASPFSPRGSIGYDFDDATNETMENKAATKSKKTKKRKKVKDIFNETMESHAEHNDELPKEEIPIANETEESHANENPLIDCPIDKTTNDWNEENAIETTVATVAESENLSNTNARRNALDTLDILKDANFYPLF
ncbi:hypothetical protein GQX74_003834 [Glossina fuscipes]|nr:hypothetical protein GQX74_003834 [Glossina fuscipes]